MKLYSTATWFTLRVCIITILFWSRTVLAQALQIMPVTIGMPHGALSNTIFITNRGTEPEMVQARPFLWSQSGGNDVLTPTEALVVSPPMTSIAPGVTQLFRILLRQPAETIEASYRLLFDELPRPNDQIGGVRLALRLSVPVFALPAQASTGGTTFSVLVDDSGAFLHAENHGVQHLRVIHPVLNEAGSAKIAVPSAEVSYILAGTTQDWPISARRRLEPGSVLRLTAASDQGPVDTTVHVLQR